MTNTTARIVRPALNIAILTTVCPIVLEILAALVIGWAVELLWPGTLFNTVLRYVVILDVLRRLTRGIWRYGATAYEITPESVVARHGIISRNVTRIRIADIRTLSLRQSLLGRLLNYGSVLIGTADTGGTELTMRDVTSPSALVELIESLRA